MSILTKTFTVPTGAILLSGPAHVVRISASGSTLGNSVALYDSTTGITQQQAALPPHASYIQPATPVRSNASDDCGGVHNTYDYYGVGPGVDTTIAAGTRNLPIVASVVGGTSGLDVDIVVARGLWAVPAGTGTITLTIEYFPNIAKPPAAA